MAATEETHIDMRAQLVHIDRAIAETRKFIAEHDKLAVEATKFRRDQAIAPWQLAILFVGSLGGFFAGAVALWHTLGH